MNVEPTDENDGFCDELAKLTALIHATMREVTAIRHPMMEHDRVEAAVDELAAIVIATEVATEQILESAESLLPIAEKLEGGDAEVLDKAVTGIFEACNFQDITGQRLSKVMSLLRDVDDRLVAMIRHYGEERFAALPPPEGSSKGEDHLLNGPSLNNAGLEQDSIDSLFD